VNDFERVVLVGFSGSGKSTVSRMLGDRLGWSVLDMDEILVSRWNKTIPEIFREDGEEAFRECERALLLDGLAKRGIIISTGGGAVADDAVWADDLLGRPDTLVVALDADPATMLDRLNREAVQAGAAVERPMLAGSDPLARIRQLKDSRQAAYDRADVTIVSENTSAAQVADEIAALATLSDTPLTLDLDAPSGCSSIIIAPGVICELGERLRQAWPKSRRAWVITDNNVGPLHLQSAQDALEASGIAFEAYSVEPGEGSKGLSTTGQLYDWLLQGGVARGDVVVALGGGVVGDLAGFVAATVLRGVGLVQVPTTLLAAVDSSVGGKTGINHPAGKNLIGAFLQPRVVLVDPNLLGTLPQRELHGAAEVVKHAVIQRSTPGGERSDLKSFITRNGANLRRLQGPALSYLIWRNIALKAAVVAADEREMGIRAFLNFGHTLGHAIEASDYHLRHGEAIALGMRAAAHIGVACGTCDDKENKDIGGLIDQFGLPKSTELDEPRVLSLLSSDKKRVGKNPRFVLPIAGGGVVMRDDISPALIAEALATVSA
jgi:shikimate kinase/3-dehydroquinate synthase